MFIYKYKLLLVLVLNVTCGKHQMVVFVSSLARDENYVLCQYLHNDFYFFLSHQSLVLFYTFTANLLTLSLLFFKHINAVV